MPMAVEKLIVNDFLAFVAVFGTSEDRFDFNDDDAVDFNDFLIFGQFVWKASHWIVGRFFNAIHPT